MAQDSLRQMDATEIVERRQDVRIMVSIPGRYSLTSRRDQQGNRREFACRAVSMSTQAIVLATPVGGPVGERVIAHIERFGRLDGSITRVLDRGFIMSITATPEERDKITEKLVWLEKHKNLELPDNRASQRIVPENPNSTLTLADGTRITCFVIDISFTGVAVSADIFPEIGTAMAVGKVVGRVVRRFTEGFAVQFVDPQIPRHLERLIAS
jgi:hypothetical protein